MSTTQSPQSWPTLKGPPHRYPISLQLSYGATSELRTLLSFGQTTMMSIQEIIFSAGGGLEPGMEAQIALGGPILLDGLITLELVLDATITGSNDGVCRGTHSGVRFPHAPVNRRLEGVAGHVPSGSFVLTPALY